MARRPLALNFHLSVSPAALIVWGVLFYFSDGKTLPALFPAVLAHEGGHLLLMKLLGLRLRALRFEFSGLCITYAGRCSSWGRAAAALAGPAAGFLYALAVSRMGGWGKLSAGFSLLLSLFNLLPVMPLDGGRISAALLGEKTAEILSVLTASALFSAGLVLFASGKGAALLLAGIFLLAAQFREQSVFESA